MTAPAPSPAARSGGGGISTRVRLAAIAVLLATFAAGAAAGIGADQWRHRHAGDRGVRHGRPDFLSPLNLTPDQRARVDSILERHRGELDSFWAGPGRQLRAIVDSTRSEVRAVLTPAQRATYDSMTTERRRRERAREVGGGPVGPPPGPRSD